MNRSFARFGLTSRTLTLAGLLGAGIVVVAAVRHGPLGGTGDSRGAGRDARPFVELHAPHVSTPIPIDAAIEGKKAWESDVGSTKVFKDENGNGMVPYTEAKVRWGDGTLYFWLYAGDLDLEGTVTDVDGPVLRDDAFALDFEVFGKVRTIDVSVLGTVADAECRGAIGDKGEGRKCDASWDSHAVVSVDRDGTLNKVGDNDEEWVVEMAVPLKSLGLVNAVPGQRIPFALRRCDIGRDGKHACGGFGAGKVRGELVLDGTELSLAQASAANP